MKRLIQVPLAIAKVTFLEVLRDKVLYNILVCAVLLLGISVLAANLSFVRQDRLLINFGLTGLSISCAMIGIFTGAGMLAREFDRRTVFMALARPISRMQFVAGKYLGLAGVIGMNWLGLVIALAGVIAIASPVGLLPALNPTLLAAVVLVLLQSLLLAAVSVFFSTFTTTSLSAILTVGLTLVGTNLAQLRLLAAKSESALLKQLIDAICLALPDLGYFNLGTKVSYGLPVGMPLLLGSLAYGLVWIALLLAGSGILIQKKES